MDINEATVVIDEPVWIDVYMPNGADAQARVLLNSPDSAVMIEFERKIERRRMAQMKRTREIDLTPEEVDAESTARAVTALAGWEGFRAGKQPLDFSPEKAKEVLTKPGMRWLRDFIDMTVRNRGNFMRASAKS